jgi:diguanylate cyclase (GGDEF)-like protein
MDYWIVVVDDEALSLTNAKNLLDKENMRTSCLRSGRDLLKFLEKNSPDLILLDIMMPEMDGFETYKALRCFENETGRSHIPVIFLTGERDYDMERRGLRAGASDFIHKPFNKDVLISRICNTIKNSKTIESLTEEATVDKMTGFLNKSSGTSRLSALCNDESGTLIMLDIDSFKLVNDLFGHDMGDRVLRAFSDILRHNTRETDVISRFGGDEFIGFFTNMTEESSVKSLTNRLNTQLRNEAEKLMGEGYGIPLGISVGAVMIPEHGRDYESLFAMADNALYMVKQNGKHGYSIYDRTETAATEEKGSLLQDIERITKIIEERNDKSGALILGREAFSIAYRCIMRLYNRYGGKVAKIIMEIDPASDKNCGNIMAASERFGHIIQKSLRSSDLIMQNRSDQFFILLNERKQFAAENVIERVLSLWNESEYAPNTEISYSFVYMDYPEKG